jgi:ubiquitin-conjugating enzyme E2 J1
MEGQYNTRSPAVKRLMREAKELSEATSDYYAQPLSDNLFEWHFTVRGPSDTEFDGGVYHGRIILPPEYPMKPPNIIILTPNGRFETGKKICLSISGYHPETWQPSWSIRTALLAIIGFMPTPGQGTIGSLDYPPEERKKLAKKSINFSCEECCSCGAPILNLLKSREEEQDEESNQKKLARAEEAKKLAMQVSFKAEGENKDTEVPNVSNSETTTPDPVFQETKEEKEKRIRKEASKRMQQKFRERLHARTSGMIEQINAKPVKSLQENTNSTPLSQIPQATQATTVNNRTATLEARANNQPSNTKLPIEILAETRKLSTKIN